MLLYMLIMIGFLLRTEHQSALTIPLYGKYMYIIFQNIHQGMKRKFISFLKSRDKRLPIDTFKNYHYRQQKPYIMYVVTQQKHQQFDKMNILCMLIIGRVWHYVQLL